MSFCLVPMDYTGLAVKDIKTEKQSRKNQVTVALLNQIVQIVARQISSNGTRVPRIEINRTFVDRLLT